MIQVYLVNRYMRERKKNGQRTYRWAMRWEESAGWRCESTGTADRPALRENGPNGDRQAERAKANDG